MRSNNVSSTKNLSKREKEVCNLLIIGNTTNQIAKVLNIKSNTVSTIKKTIYYKKNVSNIIQLYEIYKQA
jgi:two-component system uhpT operon response regulator UhpA